MLFVAEVAGVWLRWNIRKMQITDTPEVDSFIHKAYRKGRSL